MKFPTFILSLMLLAVNSYAQYVNTDLETYLNNIIDNLPGSSGNDYQEPTSLETATLTRAVHKILANDTTAARLHADSVGYQVTTLFDPGINQWFYILEESTPFSNYWGTYAFNPAASRPNLILQSPHPKYDTNTGKQGSYCFKRLNNSAFFISGTHRCNHTMESSCSGTTTACGNAAPYRISDVAHNNLSVFQALTATIAEKLPKTVFVQLHGFGKTVDDPYVIISNGTRITPEIDYVAEISDQLFIADPTLTFKIAHLDTDWTRLIGFTNVQGRFLNNSPNPCNTSASIGTGRFVHIEQEKTKLRDNAAGWEKMNAALANAFPAQTNYYVSTTGNDNNAGTFAAPWRTVQKACNSATPGSTVFILGGTYFETIWMNVSGLAGQPITFTNYLDNQVFIDGGSTGNFTELFVISGPDYLVIQGLHFQNATGNFSKGVFIGNGSDHIQFLNNTISNIHFSNNPADPVTFSTNVNPFVVYNTNASDACTNIIVSGNEIFDCRTGFSEGLTMAGNVDTFEIVNNLVHDLTNIGIDVTGGYGVSNDPNTDFARNGLVRQNTVYNCVSNYAVSAGIYVDGGQHVIVEKNISYGNGRGFEIGCEQFGHETKDITVRNNLSYENLEAGIGIGGYNYPTTGKVSNCQVLNNTFYANDQSNTYDGELLIEYTENCIIQNNIFYATDANNRLIVSRLNSIGLDLDYNLYYHAIGSSNVVYDWEGAFYQGFSSFQNGTGYDTHSQFSNPSFTDAGNNNFDLVNTSSAINAGNPLFTENTNETDLVGNNRLINLIDQGAYEFQGCVDALVLADSLRSDTYIAQSSINSSSEVNSGTNAILQANQIHLLSGFHAKHGCEFTALVDDCNLPLLQNTPVPIQPAVVEQRTIETAQPFNFVLYPNPATQTVTIGYELDIPTTLSMSIYDVFGRQVSILTPIAQQQAGHHQQQVNLNLAAGHYFVVLQADSAYQVQPLIIVE